MRRRKSEGQNSSPITAPGNGHKRGLSFDTEENVVCPFGFAALQSPLATPASSLVTSPNDAGVASMTALYGIYCLARSGPVLIASGLPPTSSIFLAGCS